LLNKRLLLCLDDAQSATRQRALRAGIPRLALRGVRIFAPLKQLCRFGKLLRDASGLGVALMHTTKARRIVTRTHGSSCANERW
jgi:hypothetical protein